ncbi:hypothetical protein [Streptomyces sp. NPDC001340]
MATQWAVSRFFAQPGAGFFRVSLLVISVMSDHFGSALLCWGRRS